MLLQPNRQNPRAALTHLREANSRAPRLAAALADRRPADLAVEVGTVAVVGSETAADSYLDMLDSAMAVRTSSAAHSARQPIPPQARSPMPERQELPMFVSWPTPSLASPFASTVPLSSS